MNMNKDNTKKMCTSCSNNSTIILWPLILILTSIKTSVCMILSKIMQFSCPYVEVVKLFLVNIQSFFSF